MNVIDDSIGIMIASADEVVELEDMKAEELAQIEGEIDEQRIQASLSSHILTVFQENKDARNTSLIDRKMLESLRAYNGHYDPEDLARIRATKGSEIFMNITPTKCRAAMSWIRDILLSSNENAFSFEPTPIPEIPKEIKDQLTEKIKQFMVQPQGEEEQGQTPTDIASKLQEQNQLQTDLEEAISGEILNVAKASVKIFEEEVADELLEGGWEDALSEFIEDFCVFQVAVMKGPIITNKKRLSWVDGQPQVVDDFCYLNKRVSPLDIYPSPSSTSINDGDLCEHVRLHRKELYNLIGVEGYKEEAIRDLLKHDNYGQMSAWLDSYIENEKVIEEYRGDEYRANKHVFHGIHYHGTASWTMLSNFGYTVEELGTDEEKEFDIEAILIGDKVIKAVIQDDPMLRRPYYKASFQNIPGSFWGRSLPELMRDIQRLCNATARALANNMGVASGPQVMVNIDRLAADEEIESIYPFKIWQTTSDPTGNTSKPLDFFQPTSNAGELLKVYETFELRADDATSIPRYAYGNDNNGTAALTATGLGMLLETASKGIKDAISHIDRGLIIPRVEYQFYYNIMTNPDSKFTGDIKVIAKGSKALTARGSQQMMRNEFLQIVSQPGMIDIVGMEGIAEILREMSDSLGLSKDIVPSRIELRYKQQQAEKARAAQAKAEAEAKANEQATGVKQVGMQTEQAEKASMRNAQLKAAELQHKEDDSEKDRQLKAALAQLTNETAEKSIQIGYQKSQADLAQKDRSQNKGIALSINSGFRDKDNNT